MTYGNINWAFGIAASFQGLRVMETELKTKQFTMYTFSSSSYHTSITSIIIII